MKFAIRGVSGAALILGLAGGVTPAFAQQTGQTVNTTQTPTAPAPAPQTAPEQTQPADEASGDRVVILGSLIATTPEDAPKPVEVFTADELAASGAPSVSEFVRSLTSSYGSDLGFGQASADTVTGAGFANADLRGLGSNATLVMVNGRRLASTNGGFGADINTVPMEALEAVEVLKDGASSTYGAGAVGGVINFRTRRDIDAPQITIEKTFYDGSDGAYKIDFLTGWVGDSSNLMISMSYNHEDAMLQEERDFGSLPFQVNPGSAASPSYIFAASNPGRYLTSTNFLGAAATGTAFVNDLPGGAASAAARTACEAIGGEMTGVIQPGTATNNCAVHRKSLQDVVNLNDSYRAYVEFNADITDTMEFHADVTYTKSETWTRNVPIGPQSTTNQATDHAINSTLCTTSSCHYVIPVQVNTYTTAATGGAPTTSFVRNPFISDFIARTGVTLPDTGALYISNSWRPFMFGGSPYYEGDSNGMRYERFQRERTMMNAGLKGEFTSEGIFGFLNGVTYDYAAQFNQYIQNFMQPDISVARLQNALLGYGGPNCNAVDRVPTDFSSAAAFNRTIGVQSNIAAGTNGCQWFNPFVSNFTTSIVNNAVNPMQPVTAPLLTGGNIAGLTATPRPSGWNNPRELLDWMYLDKASETQYTSGTFDATFTGQVPESWFQLPGGPIGWAAGGQWRMLERRDMFAIDAPNTNESAREELLALQLCGYPDPSVVGSPQSPSPEPGTRGCSTSGGAFFGSNRPNITVRDPPNYEDSQTIAFFAEVQLPIFDNFNMSASVRREDYNGGDLVGDIWNVSGKYNITDDLYVRASYGTNFRAEAAVDLSPGAITTETATVARFGQLALQQSTIVDDSIGVEDDTTLNIGVGYQTMLGDGRLRASLDFFEISIDGAVITTPSAAPAILNSIFGVNSIDPTLADSQRNRTNPAIPDAAGAIDNAGQFADCTSPFINFVTFSTPCVTGTTTAANLIELQRFQLNGPGQVTNGLDFSLDYTHPLWGGDFGVNITATQNFVYKQKGYSINNVVFQADRNCLSYSNLGSTCNTSPRTRANGTVRWANDTHAFNVRANYTSGMEDDRFFIPAQRATAFTAISVTPQLFSTYGVERKPYLDFDFNYVYTAPFWEELEMRFTVLNIFDKDPMPSQNSQGYLSGIGNPRGRIIEIGATKKF